MNLARRRLFLGFASLLAAPAVVRASSIMSVKTPGKTPGYPIIGEWEFPPHTTEEILEIMKKANTLLQELELRTRRVTYGPIIRTTYPVNL